MSTTEPMLDIDPGQIVPIEVWPLYRSADCEDELEGWIVEGTADEAVARRKVALYIEDEYGDDEWVRGLLARLAESRAEVRTDWRWEIDDVEETQHLRTTGPGEKFTGVRFWA